MNTIKNITKILLCLFPLSAIAHLPTSQHSATNTIAPMLKKVTPAIVNIYVEKTQLKKLSDLLPMQGDSDTKIPVKTYAVGSGVIFDNEKGYIITNEHVIKNEKVMTVTLKNGERYHALLIAKDKNHDIAIIQIHATHLTALPFGNSDNVAVGDFATAIGSPYGLSQTVTSGMVSAVNRTHPQIEGYQNFIQTDAPINPGNSGGALINMQGQLIGINTALMSGSDSNSGIGFAIPSNMVHSVINQLLIYGKVKRSVLGVIVENLTPNLLTTLNLNQKNGAIVSDVLPNTPASFAGIQPEDVITKINQTPIQSAAQLRNLMGLTRPNTTLKLTFIHNKKERTVTIKAGDPKKIKQVITPYLHGLQLQSINEIEKNGHEVHGVLVTDMSDNSNGSLAGLQPGDIITAINTKPINSLHSLKTLLSDKTKPVMLTVMHHGVNMLLILNP